MPGLERHLGRQAVLVAGDLIYACNGRLDESAQQFQSLLSQLTASQPAKLMVARNVRVKGKGLEPDRIVCRALSLECPTTGARFV